MTLINGYDGATRQRLARRITDAVRATIQAPLDGITVAINEVAPDGYMRGGAARAPGAPCPEPKDQVLAFLKAMEDRRLDVAKRYLGDGFTMVFPGVGGGTAMTSLEALVEWSAHRYRLVKKTIDHAEEAVLGEAVIVYVFGVLHGEWPDGTPFDGIRFIDRFETIDGLILRQQVWNDLAEARPTGD